MVSASVTTSPELRVQEPRDLFEIPSSVRALYRPYDVSADGQRSLMVEAVDVPPPQIVVIPEFREELEARLAATPR